MPAPTTETQNRTQPTNFTDSLNRAQTPSSIGAGIYDDTVIPPSHNARTVVLCFDGTGDQFDVDVCARPCSWCLYLRVLLVEFEHCAVLLDAQEGR